MYRFDGVTLHIIDALAGASLLLPQSIHTIVTSPPYWSLRSYLDKDDPKKPLELGTEPTLEEYVERIVQIFRALRPALRDDGTLWLNLGSTYWGGGRGNYGNGKSVKGREGVHLTNVKNRNTLPGFKPKDLIPIPWIVGLALQHDGWYLRADNIWSKPNCMPSSVSDRPTISHEYVLLLSKSQRYYFNQDAVREPYARLWDEKNGRGIYAGSDCKDQKRNDAPVLPYHNGRNIRSVWTISTRRYPGSHYAVFPPKLVEPCIKAGCPEDGTVLDPFIGSGTTALVARQLGRKSIGFDLDERNIRMIEERFGYQDALL